MSGRTKKKRPIEKHKSVREKQRLINKRVGEKN